MLFVLSERIPDSEIRQISDAEDKREIPGVEIMSCIVTYDKYGWAVPAGTRRGTASTEFPTPDSWLSKLGESESQTDLIDKD